MNKIKRKREIDLVRKYLNKDVRHDDIDMRSLCHTVVDVLIYGKSRDVECQVFLKRLEMAKGNLME